jgi:thioredoxin reductase (NADPH)
MAQETDEVLDPTDPYQRQAQTFPELSEDQVARVRAFGMVEQVPAGTPLFSRGERGADFFVVIDGAIEIVDPAGDAERAIVHRHGARQFSGELDQFNNRSILVSGRAAVDCAIIRVPRRNFRRMIDAEPDIGEIIMRAFILRRVGLMRHAQGGITVIGSAHDGDRLHIQQFLTRNGYPFHVVDSDVEGEAARLMEEAGAGGDDLPLVLLQGGAPLRRPSSAVLADAIGLTESFDPDHIHDLAVIGAGPAGLAAAVYAASEGLDTVVIEKLAPGGQAGTSSRIENYLGFPTGISGQALAGRAQVQAQKFGARLAISRCAVRLHCDDRPFCIDLDDGQVIRTHAVVIATGARYRRLSVPGYERFEGQGIHYAATWIESGLCESQEVIVVGGGNSAGQAAVFLSGVAAHVHILVRSEGLAATMSDYLIQRIERSPKITLHTHSEITALEGDRFLERVGWANRRDGSEQMRNIGNVFVMIGAAPNTEWLDGCVPLDRGGFVETGEGSPYQTTTPGIFAVGDVRAGSTKRVASGVGEGSVVVSSIHQYLAGVRTRI